MTMVRGLYGTPMDCYGTRWESGQLGTAYYSQYQKMKKEWKNTVYLARSRIQGLGLYASRDIEMNSMIIEYKGEVIRSEVRFEDSVFFISFSSFPQFRLVSLKVWITCKMNI